MYKKHAHPWICCHNNRNVSRERFPTMNLRIPGSFVFTTVQSQILFFCPQQKFAVRQFEPSVASYNLAQRLPLLLGERALSTRFIANTRHSLNDKRATSWCRGQRHLHYSSLVTDFLAHWHLHPRHISLCLPWRCPFLTTLSLAQRRQFMANFWIVILYYATLVLCNAGKQCTWTHLRAGLSGY